MEVTIRITRLPINGAHVKYSIDAPKERAARLEKNSFIKLKGWFFCADGRVPEFVTEGEDTNRFSAKIERRDVVRAHKEAPLLCGFETFIEAGIDTKVGAFIDGTVYWFARISYDAVNVLIGEGGHLFLDKDSNQSVAQYAGELLINQDNLNAWNAYFQKIAVQKENQSFNTTFLIAPAKEYVFPDYYPVVRKGATPYDQFILNFYNKASIVNPLTELMHERNFTYSKVDTHWTHYGARVAAELTCHRLGHPFTDPQYNYKFIKTGGDLGTKISPPVTECLPEIDLVWISEFRIFDNRVSNRGRVHVYHNDQAGSDKTCIVFGDSFSMFLVPHLIFSFRRLVHIFSGADIDWDIVSLEKPDFVISEMTTRFFIKAPSVEFSLRTELTRKLSSLNNEEKISALKHLDKFTDTSIDYYKSISKNALQINFEPGL